MNIISVKQLGSRSGRTFCQVWSGLIWVQTVCKGYQQMTKVTTSEERVNRQSIRHIFNGKVLMFFLFLHDNVLLALNRSIGEGIYYHYPILRY